MGTSSRAAAADRVKNSLIAVKIAPPVQASVGSQVVEKPAEKVSTRSTNDDDSVSSSDSNCSGSSDNSSSTSSGQSSSSESSKQSSKKIVANDGNTVVVAGVTTATVAIADVIAAVSAATPSVSAVSWKPPFRTLGDTALANEPGWLPASILQAPLAIVEEEYGPGTPSSTKLMIRTMLMVWTWN
jgi:hypothetical protein